MAQSGVIPPGRSKTPGNAKNNLFCNGNGKKLTDWAEILYTYTLYVNTLSSKISAQSVQLFRSYNDKHFFLRCETGPPQNFKHLPIIQNCWASPEKTISVKTRFSGSFQTICSQYNCAMNVPGLLKYNQTREKMEMPFFRFCIIYSLFLHRNKLQIFIFDS